MNGRVRETERVSYRVRVKERVPLASSWKRGLHG
jgi:hypothetical protein